MEGKISIQRTKSFAQQQPPQKDSSTAPYIQKKKTTPIQKKISLHKVREAILYTISSNKRAQRAHRVRKHCKDSSLLLLEDKTKAKGAREEVAIFWPFFF